MTSKSTTQPPRATVSGPARRDRMLREPHHDPYRMDEKPSDPSVCPDCESAFRDGRWTWAAGPVDAPRILCPACRRIRDGVPAGIVQVRGVYAQDRRDELVRLMRNVEERERGEHALERLMSIRDLDGGFEVQTTGIHLARALATALHAAHQGDLQLDHEEEILRATWRR